MSYVDGPDADRVARLRAGVEDEQLASALVDALSAELGVELGAPASWVFTPHAAGFHANVDPDFARHPLASGDVALAGESTADPQLRAWMEGALQAAERAVNLLNF